MKKAFSIFILLSALTLRLLAIPAYPEMIRFSQPGREVYVNIFLKGDEKVHWAESEDGYSLLYANDGALVYAMRDMKGDMVASQYVATDIKNRSLEVIQFLANTPKHLHFSEKQVSEMRFIWEDMTRMKREAKEMTNVIGEKKFLVILFAFNDRAFTHTKTDFKHLFNQVNYSEHNAMGSVHDYYNDVSQGQFSLSVDVVGPYRGIYDHDHYGDDSGYQDFAEEAVENASHDVDFSDYDNDNDGYIDGLHIIFAGHGEEAGAGSDCIWSHKWNIFSSPVYNNTVVNVYSCSPECNGNSGDNITNIGVICHELGHVFGSPDYYDTDYAGSGGEYNGLGIYDIMSSGSWNRGGRCPAHHNPYTKIFVYHWATADTLTETQTVLMQPAEHSNTDFHIVTTSTPGDFFLLENRQRHHWDLGLSSHGMVVYHIHPNAHGANVSNYRHPQQIYILANTADAYPNSEPSSYGYLNDDGAVYPRINGTLDSITDNSVPAFIPWSHIPNNTPITHISECAEDSTIAFCFKGATPTPFGFEAEGISNSQIKLNWQRYGKYKYIVTMSQEPESFTLPEGFYSEGQSIEGTNSTIIYMGNKGSFIVDSLMPSETRYFNLFICLTDSTYGTELLADATTLECGASQWGEEDFESYESWTLPQCWNGTLSEPASPIETPFDNCSYTQGWKIVEPNMPCALDLLTGKALMGTSLNTPMPIILPPFGTDSLTDMVFSFDFLGNLAFEDDTLEILYRQTPESEWQIVGKEGALAYGLGWHTAYVTLPQVSSYSLLALQLSNHEIFIDNLNLELGQLLYAHANEGGTITPKGRQVVHAGDSIEFKMSHQPGYKLKKLWVDGKSKTFLQGDRFATYTLAVKGNHEVYAEFVRDLSIEEHEETFKLYPNPSQGDVQVELVDNEALVLYDIYGRLIWKGEGVEGVTSIPLAHLSNGVYILRIGNTSVKIIKR